MVTPKNEIKITIINFLADYFFMLAIYGFIGVVMSFFDVLLKKPFGEEAVVFSAGVLTLAVIAFFVLHVILRCLKRIESSLWPINMSFFICIVFCAYGTNMVLAYLYFRTLLGSLLDEDKIYLVSFIIAICMILFGIIRFIKLYRAKQKHTEQLVREKLSEEKIYFE